MLALILTFHSILWLPALNVLLSKIKMAPVWYQTQTFRLLIIQLAATSLLLYRIHKKKKAKHVWVRPLHQDMETKGEFNVLIRDILQHNDVATFLLHFWMSPAIVDFSWVEGSVGEERVDLCTLCSCASAGVRFVMTIHFSCTAETQLSVRAR